MLGSYLLPFQPATKVLLIPNTLIKEKQKHLRDAFTFIKRTPEQRKQKIRFHLNSISGLSPILERMVILHSGKDISRGLRAVHRARAFGWIALSTGAWVASAGVAVICPPAIIPLTTVAAALSAVAFAEEWRTSERMFHRQKKQEMIRTNQAIFHIPADLTTPGAAVIKKTYLTENQAKKSFKYHLERIWREYPELHLLDKLKIQPAPYVPISKKNTQTPPQITHFLFEIPFYCKRHRLSIFTPNKESAKVLFLQAYQQYQTLFLQDVPTIAIK